MTVDAFGNLDRDSRNPPSNESFTLKAKTAVYEVSIPQLQKLFVEKLGVPEDRITISPIYRDVPDSVDERFDRSVFNGLLIIVKD